jgi:hypothetical protein
MGLDEGPPVMECGRQDSVGFIAREVDLHALPIHLGRLCGPVQHRGMGGRLTLAVALPLAPQA